MNIRQIDVAHLQSNQIGKVQKQVRPDFRQLVARQEPADGEENFTEKINRYMRLRICSAQRR